MGEASTAAKTEIAWAAHPGGQQLVLSCPIQELLVEGNRGGGKTDVALAKFVKHVGQGYGSHWRGVCFRREYKHLDDLVIKSKRFFKKAFPKAKFKESKSDYKWVFPDGEELLFRRIKDASGYWDFHGHEYPFIHFEELTNWPDDGAWEAMKSCNRSSHKGVPKIYMANCNPYGAGHTWVKELFIKPDIDGDEVPWGTILTDDEGNKRVRIHIDLQENTDLMEADPGYIKRLDAIGNNNLREAWRHGNWDIVVGGFLQGIWSHKDHIVDDFDIPREWPRWRAMDWGFSRPYSVGWYTMAPDGTIYRYRELYGYGGKANTGTREDIVAVCKKIKELEAMERKAGIEFRKNPADSAIWAEQGGVKRDGRELTIGELSKKAGVPWMPAKKGPGSRKSGAQVVIKLLNEGKFKVFRSCKHFLRTVPVLMPDEDDWDDVDTEQEDHAWDELRYSLVSRHRPSKHEGRKHTGPKPGTFDWLISLGKAKGKHPLKM